MKRLQSEHTAQKHEYEHTQAQVNAVHDDLTDLEEQRRSPDVTGHYAKKDQSAAAELYRNTEKKITMLKT